MSETVNYEESPWFKEKPKSVNMVMSIFRPSSFMIILPIIFWLITLITRLVIGLTAINYENISADGMQLYHFIRAEEISLIGAMYCISGFTTSYRYNGYDGVRTLFLFFAIISITLFAFGIMFDSLYTNNVLVTGASTLITVYGFFSYFVGVIVFALAWSTQNHFKSHIGDV